MHKNIAKNISRNLSGKYSQKVLDHAKNVHQMSLKLIQKQQFKKQEKHLVIWLVITLLMKLRKLQKTHNNIIQRKLQMSIVKKYLKKDLYLQRKDRKLLMIRDYYDNKIMEYQKIIDLLDNTPNQPSKFKTKNWVEINDDERGAYNTSS